MNRLLPLLVVAVAVPALAETHRIAIVVGSNAGAGEQPPLRYAETDAGKIAEVLVDLGGVDSNDLLLLQGRTLAELKEALSVASARVAHWRGLPDQRVVLLFYFSGHSDGEALELGRDRLRFADLRRWLDDTHAEVRLAIIDSCRSGALLAAKGATPSAPFEIHLDDQLSSTGQAVLTSSAADELALESSEIRGSFFTHHLVSGLRGAADASGDGRVTLAEAYQYAFAHTVSATSATTVGAQHPVYDYQMSGQGELVLSELSRTGGSLVLPAGFDRALVTNLVQDRVLAELVRGAAARVVVPAGEYGVRAWKNGVAYAGRFTLATAESRAVAWSDLQPMEPTPVAPKGEMPEAAAAAAVVGPPDPFGLFVAGGVARGVAESLGPTAAVRVGLRPRGLSGLSVTLDAETGAGSGFHETSALLLAGYLFALTRGNWKLYGGVEGGVGEVFQALPNQPLDSSFAFALAPTIGVDYQLSRPVSVALEGDALGAVVQMTNGVFGVVFLPAVWLGVRIAL